MKYMAVECSKCNMLQAKHVSESKSAVGSKWSCTICNEKQSLRRVFITSESAKDVRTFVQKFNLTAGLARERASLNASYYQSDHKDEEEETTTTDSDARASKWEQYLPEEETRPGSWDEPEQSDDDEKKITTAVPDLPRRKKSRKQPSMEKSEGKSSPPQQLIARNASIKNNESDEDLNSKNREIEHGTSSSGIDEPINVKRGRDYGECDDSRPLCKSWESLTDLEVPRQSSDCDGSVKERNSCLPPVSGAPISKWSKYLT